MTDIQISKAEQLGESLVISTLIAGEGSLALENKPPEIYVWDIHGRILRFGDHSAWPKEKCDSQPGFLMGLGVVFK
jgi:hypothetical protein